MANKPATGLTLFEGGLGLLAGLGVGACCILPLLAGATGLFAVSLGDQFLAYRPWLAGASIFFLGLAWWQLVRGARANGRKSAPCCEGEEGKPVKLPVVPTVLLSLITVVSLGVMGWSFLNTSSMQTGSSGLPSAEAASPANGGETIPAVAPEPVEPEVAYFKVEGMTCESCATGLEFTLRRKPGVIDAQVDYEEARAMVKYDPSKTDPKQIQQWINQTGYQGQLIDQAAWEQLAAQAESEKVGEQAEEGKDEGK